VDARDEGKPFVSISTNTKKLAVKLGIRSARCRGENLCRESGRIRKIRWDSFRPKFFLVFSAGGSWMAAALRTDQWCF